MYKKFLISFMVIVAVALNVCYAESNNNVLDDQIYLNSTSTINTIMSSDCNVSISDAYGPVVAYNNKIYVFDRYVTAVYNIALNSWSSASACGFDSDYAVLFNNQIYVAQMSSDGYDGLFKRFNPVSGSWSNYLCDVPESISGMAVANNSIYVITTDGVPYKYNISADSWERKTSLASYVSFKRCSMVAYNNKIYCAGFQDYEPEYSNTSLIYNTITDSWEDGGYRPCYAIVGCGGGTYLNMGNYLFYQGGCSEENYEYEGFITDKQPMIYDPNTNEWSIVTDTIDISGGLSYWEWAYACSYNGKVYFLRSSKTEPDNTAFAITTLPQYN